MSIVLLDGCCGRLRWLDSAGARLIARVLDNALVEGLSRCGRFLLIASLELCERQILGRSVEHV